MELSMDSTNNVFSYVPIWQDLVKKGCQVSLI
jgi:hypothetical protein